MSDNQELTYSTTEAARLAQVSRRQLQHWDECRLVVPDRAPGIIESGPKRLYTGRDIERARLVKQMIARGLRVKAIRRVLRQVKIRGDGAAWMTISGGQCRFWSYPKDLIEYGARIAGGMITLELESGIEP